MVLMRKGVSLICKFFFFVVKTRKFNARLQCTVRVLMTVDYICDFPSRLKRGNSNSSWPRIEAAGYPEGYKNLNRILFARKFV